MMIHSYLFYGYVLVLKNCSTGVFLYEGDKGDDDGADDVPLLPVLLGSSPAASQE